MPQEGDGGLEKSRGWAYSLGGVPMPAVWAGSHTRSIWGGRSFGPAGECSVSDQWHSRGSDGEYPEDAPSDFDRWRCSFPIR